jgi:peptidoglycan/LPS O-acetylase OafA/YrhL
MKCAPSALPAEARDPALSSPAGNRPRQLLGLDLLRFLAAMLVVFHHYGWAFGIYWHKGVAPRLADYAWVGFVGVQIFFVLSGFVIAYSAQRVTPINFIRSRFMRLYPAAWVCTACTLLVSFLGHHPFDHQIKSSVDSFLLSPIGPWVDGVYWTLGVELSFYFIIFLLLVTRNFHRIDIVMSTVGMISTLCVLYAAGNLHHWFHIPHLGGRYANQVFNIRILSLLLLPFGCFFALGTLIWRCLFDRVTLSRLIMILICFAGGLIETRVHAGWVADDFPSRHWIAAPAIFTVAVLLIVASVRWNVAFHQKVGAKGARVIRRIGLLTYPLYLLHQRAGDVLIEHLRAHLPYVYCAVLAGMFSLSAAFAINVYAEEPLQRLLRKYIPSKMERQKPVLVCS